MGVMRGSSVSERALGLLVVAAVVVAGCGGRGRGAGGAGDVTIAVRAASNLADAPVEVDVRGLAGHGRAMLAADWRRFALGRSPGAVWTSRTPLRANADGTVVLRGLDGMRFLWAMRPARPTDVPVAFEPPATGPSDVALRVIVGGRTVARASLSRRISPASVRIHRLTVRRDGLDGLLFSPVGSGRRPAVLALGGSGGGNEMVWLAGLLAAHGYPTLALAYAGEPGLPSRVARIPLEYFARAGGILRGRADVDPAHVVALGASYGGEAALLVAADFPHVFHGAVGLVPSAVVTSGFPLGRPAWTLHNRTVFEQGQPIPVERISGPVLTEGAGQDGTWDSAGAVSQVEQRLTDHGFGFAHVGLVYPQAGHGSGAAIPYLPTPTDQASRGGTPRADAAAKAALWPRILTFLDHLS